MSRLYNYHKAIWISLCSVPLAIVRTTQAPNHRIRQHHLLLCTQRTKFKNGVCRKPYIIIICGEKARIGPKERMEKVWQPLNAPNNSLAYNFLFIIVKKPFSVAVVCHLRPSFHKFFFFFLSPYIFHSFLSPKIVEFNALAKWDCFAATPKLISTAILKRKEEKKWNKICVKKSSSVTILMRTLQLCRTMTAHNRMEFRWMRLTGRNTRHAEIWRMSTVSRMEIGQSKKMTGHQMRKWAFPVCGS